MGRVPEKELSSHSTRATIRRGWQMSLPLVPDANHPAFPTRSKVDDWEIKRPVPLDCAEEMAHGRDWTEVRASKTLKRTYSDQSHRRRPIRHRTSPRNQPGSRREPRDQRGEQDRPNERKGTCPKKRLRREASKRRAEKK